MLRNRLGILVFSMIVFCTILLTGCVQKQKESLSEEPVIVKSFTPPIDWEVYPQTYSWSGGSENYSSNIERALRVNATVVGRGSWATFPEEWECLVEEINRAHDNGLIYLGNINLLGFCEFYSKAQEKYIEDYNIENSKAIDISGDVIPHIVTEIGVAEYEVSYNLLDPNWQDFIKDISKQTIDAGADGIYFDDLNFAVHMMDNKGEFSIITQGKFVNYLKEKYTVGQLRHYGVSNIDNFNYAEFLKEKYNFDKRNIDSFSREERTESLLYDFEEFLVVETSNFLKELTCGLKEYGKQKYNKDLKFTGIPSSGFMLAYSYFPFSTLEYIDIPSGHITYIDEALLFEGETRELYFPEKKNIPEYKIVYALTGKPKLTSVSDMTVSLLLNQKNRIKYGQNNYKDFIRLAMAEAFVNRGNFFDINYPPVEYEIVGEYNDFYLSNKEIFEFSKLNSIANVALIYPANNYMYLNFINYDHRSFYAAALALTDLNIQYDIYIAGDGLEYSDRGLEFNSKLELEKIKEYKTVIMPSAVVLSDREINIFLNYAANGGILIFLGEAGLVDEEGSNIERDEFINLENGWNSYYDGYIYYSKDVIEDNLFYFNYSGGEISRNIPARENLNVIINKYNKYQPVSLNPKLDTITIQLWEDNDKAYIHLLNYDYLWENDNIKSITNIKLKLDFLKNNPKCAVIISPDFEGEKSLDIVDYTIKVPELYIWDIIIVNY
jgi:hypothetical protein